MQSPPQGESFVTLSKRAKLSDAEEPPRSFPRTEPHGDLYVPVAALLHVLLKIDPSMTVIALDPKSAAAFTHEMETNGIHLATMALAAAEKGDTHGMCLLALALAFGQGTEVDHGKAEEWLRRAAKAGHTVAQNLLCLSYERDATWLQKADAARFVCTPLDKNSRQNNPLLELLRILASLRYACQFSPWDVAWQKSVNYQGAAYTQALLAAGLGKPMALFLVGALHAGGQLLVQDWQAVAYFFLGAAQMGDVQAMYSLGLMYKKGAGVPRNSKIAYRWFVKCAERGLVGAQEILFEGYQYGITLREDWDKALYWATQAAMQGSARGQEYITRIEHGWITKTKLD